MPAATLHTDGGARGNPGPAGIGYVLAVADGPTHSAGDYIGEATNNQAEYQALIAGLGRAKQEGVTVLECFLDSELVVKQLRGEYRVKDAKLKPLVAVVHELIEQFDTVTFTHVPRAENKEADQLVNQAIDKSV